MNIKQIIKEEIEDFNWVKQVSDDLIPGQKYFIKSGNNWSEYEFVEYDPDYDYEYDHGEFKSMEVYKFKHRSGTSMMSKSLIDELKSKGLVRVYDENFSFESFFRWGNIGDIDSGDSFAIYFRDGVNIDDTIPIQKILLKKGFRFYTKEEGRSYLTSADLGDNKKVLMFESINWDINHKSMGIYPYNKMDPKQRDKKLLLLVGYPEGKGWWSGAYSEEYLRNDIERSTNELPHHNAIVIDGHKLLNSMLTEQEDIDWIDEVPDYLGFENLEFGPHKLALNFPEMEELTGYLNNGIMDRFKGMIHATMNFGQDEDGHEIWISVVGGGPTYSDIEDDVWEVWSSELEDPVAMSRDEVTEHMKELQGYKG